MAVGYTRQSSGLIITAATIQASHFNNEYDAIQAAFHASTGHNHDGTAGGGAPIGTTSISNNAITLAKMATVSTATFLGRNTSGTGNVESLSVATAKGMLGVDYIATTGAVSTAPTAASGTNGIAIGDSAKVVTGTRPIAIGKSYASGTDSVAIAISNNTSSYGAQGQESIAMGYHASASQIQAVAIGSDSVASASNAISIGGANAGGQYSVALGAGADASDFGAIAISASNATASGANAIAIGDGSVASFDSCITIGDGTASGDTSACIASEGSTSSGINSLAMGGASNTASGEGSYALGYNSVANKYGQFAFGYGTGFQESKYGLSRTFTNSTPAELWLLGANNTRLTIATDTSVGFTAIVVARRTDADNETNVYEVKGAIDNNAGTTALVGTPTVTVIHEDTPAWDLAVTADNTNDALIFTFTSENSKTVKVGGVVTCVEVTG